MKMVRDIFWKVDNVQMNLSKSSYWDIIESLSGDQKIEQKNWRLPGKNKIKKTPNGYRFSGNCQQVSLNQNE